MVNSVPNRGAIASKGANVTPRNQAHAHMLRDGARTTQCRTRGMSPKEGAEWGKAAKRVLEFSDVLRKSRENGDAAG